MLVEVAPILGLSTSSGSVVETQQKGCVPDGRMEPGEVFTPNEVDEVYISLALFSLRFYCMER